MKEKNIIHRTLTVLFVGILQFTILFCSEEYWRNYLKVLTDGNQSAWLGPVLTLLIAAPIAFCIWIFRNTDKRVDQQHAEENIRQADFHKIEEWATNFDTNIDNEIKDSTKSNPVNSALQIAAIYQLVPYMRGYYGSRFVRPTIEIYHSLLSTWNKVDKISTFEESIDLYKNKPRYIDALHKIFMNEMINSDVIKRKANPAFSVIQFHWIPLSNIQLPLIHLSDIEFKDIDLIGASFKFAKMTTCKFVKTNLFMADFSGSQLFECDFSKAHIYHTNFNHVNFRKTTFNKNPLLMNSDFSNADLRGSSFSGANLRNSIFGVGANKSRYRTTTASSPSIEVLLNSSKKINTFKHAQLQYSDFSNSTLNNCRFIETELSRCDFRGAVLTNCTFTDFNLSLIDFTEADLIRWINEDKVKFRDCFIYSDKKDIDLNIFLDAKIQIKSVSRYIKPVNK